QSRVDLDGSSDRPRDVHYGVPQQLERVQRPEPRRGVRRRRAGGQRERRELYSAGVRQRTGGKWDGLLEHLHPVGGLRALRQRDERRYRQEVIAGRLRAIRAHPLLSPTAVGEGWREWLGGYPADRAHEPHLVPAIEWLVRAHEATSDGGIARGYSLAWHPYF